MLETSARLLRVLSLLQLHRDWTGAELANRLGVTTRTVRSDIEKLRSLGYPVHASPGVAGGYRLGAGAKLPPLLLDDDEAVAIAVGLRTAAGGTVSGIEEASLRALIKLEQVLPSRLRHRIATLTNALVLLPGTSQRVDADVLVTIAAACRDHHRLRFDYRRHDGTSSLRDTEPNRLAHGSHRWYLLAWDIGRDDWRTFRVDRMTLRTPTGPRFAPREAPADDVARFVSTGVETATWQFRASVIVHAPAEQIAQRLPQAIDVTPLAADRCRIDVGSDSPQLLAAYLGMIGTDFEVVDSPELAEQLRILGTRFTRAATDR